MTATSVMTPTVATRSWNTLQRVAAIVVMLVVFSVLAFSVGRATAHTTHAPTVFAPASVASPEPALRCAVNHPC